MATMQMSVRAEDLSQLPKGGERIPEAGVLVIFGASGDLTKRKLLPALFHLFQAKLLPKQFAIVGVAARLVLDARGSVSDVAVGVTGVGPAAYRATGVESELHGKSPTAKRIEEAAAHAADGVQANSDLYASSEYRGHLASIYTRRALEKAVERAGVE